MDVYDYERGNYQWTIYLNEKLGELSKRYVIAHEFSHYVLSQIQEEKQSLNCVEVLFPKSIEEQICDIMASFLLMPIESVLFLLDNYVKRAEENGDCPIHLEDFMRHLGYKLKVSDYYIPIFYQYIKNLGGALYENDFKDIDGNLVFEDAEKYKRLFF